MKTENPIITFMSSKEIKELLEKEAQENCTSVSSVLRLIVYRYFNSKNVNKGVVTNG